MGASLLVLFISECIYAQVCLCLCQFLSTVGKIGNALALEVLELDRTGDWQKVAAHSYPVKYVE